MATMTHAAAAPSTSTATSTTAAAAAGGRARARPAAASPARGFACRTMGVRDMPGRPGLLLRPIGTRAAPQAAGACV